MNIEKAVKDTMRNALSRLSNEFQTHVLKLRVKISKDGGDLKIEVLKGTDKIGDTTLKKMLNLGLDILGKENMVSNSMSQSISKLSGSDGIPIDEINVRIFTRNQNTVEPDFYLYNRGRPIRPLKFNEVI